MKHEPFGTEPGTAVAHPRSEAPAGRVEQRRSQVVRRVAAGAAAIGLAAGVLSGKIDIVPDGDATSIETPYDAENRRRVVADNPQIFGGAEQTTTTAPEDQPDS